MFIAYAHTCHYVPTAPADMFLRRIPTQAEILNLDIYLPLLSPHQDQVCSELQAGKPRRARLDIRACDTVSGARAHMPHTMNLQTKIPENSLRVVENEQTMNKNARVRVPASVRPVSIRR